MVLSEGPSFCCNFSSPSKTNRHFILGDRFIMLEPQRQAPCLYPAQTEGRAEAWEGWSGVHLGRIQGSEEKWRYFKNGFGVALCRLLCSVGWVSVGTAGCCFSFLPPMEGAPGTLRVSAWPGVPLSPWGPDVNVAVQTSDLTMAVCECVCILCVMK